MPRELRPCGTLAAYDRHRRNGEKACQPCVEAMRAHNRARKRHATVAAVPIIDHLPDGELDLTGAACHPWTGLHDSRSLNEGDQAWQRRLTLARAVCRRCPVIAQCRAQAIRYRDEGNRLDGIFAGQHYRHRAVGT